MLAQLGLLAPQSKQAYVEEETSKWLGPRERPSARNHKKASHLRPRPPSGPRGQETSSPPATGPVPLPLKHLVGGNCTKPLKNSLDFGLARLRRHFLSFPDTTASDSSRHGPIRGGEGGLTAPSPQGPDPPTSEVIRPNLDQ